MKDQIQSINLYKGKKGKINRVNILLTLSVFVCVCTSIISILGLIAVISLSLKLRTKITFRKNERISNKEV